MRTLIAHQPYLDLDRGKTWYQRGLWPCSWVRCPAAGAPPHVAAYRLRFDLPNDALVRAHVTADERYELFLDGERIGRGSERGDTLHWFFETYDLPLTRGEHILVARVWSLGSMAPYAQMSACPGFLFSTEGEFIELLGTGVANWEAKPLAGYTFHDPSPAWGTGANLCVDGKAFPWGFERGEGGGWQPAEPAHSGMNPHRAQNVEPHRHRTIMHLLRPATLPPMLERTRNMGVVRFVGEGVARPAGAAHTEQACQPEQGATPDAQHPSHGGGPRAVRADDNLATEQAAWQALADGRAPLAVPPRTSRRVIVDLGDYCCAYPELLVSHGLGSTIRLSWAESLYCEPTARTKGARDGIEGKYYVGVGDTFLPDGGPARRFDTLWWQAGRYVELQVETGDAPLTIESLGLRETRYPLEMEASFTASDPRYERIIPVLLRGLQMCAHETYMDCPYYEQLMYVGDTRLEALTTYVVNHDDRLPRKALATFNASRQVDGLTQSRYPSRVRQIIPPFSLWWVNMVHDYALWRGDRSFVSQLMPGVRGVLDFSMAFRNAEGLVSVPVGWNYLDWVPAWAEGIPPGGDYGVNAALNWQVVLALMAQAGLESWLGEPELAQRAQRLARELASRITARFWDESRQLLADDEGKRHFSEHTQCLALLSTLLEPRLAEAIGRSLLHDESLTHTTIYFTHYLFEAYRLLGDAQRIHDRLGLWFDLVKNGLRTTPEQPEPTRSDCHGWGAHPLHHYYATILGIRPASMGFEMVEIRPLLKPLTWARGRMVHPRGHIEVDLRRDVDALRGHVTLPEGVTGVITFRGERQSLVGGRQEVVLG